MPPVAVPKASHGGGLGASVLPLPSGGLRRPPMAAAPKSIKPPEEKGFLSPLRRRHGDYLIAHYAAQHAENLCVAHTVVKMV